MATVTTKEELEAARERGESEIIIVGELATKVHQGKDIGTYGPAAIAILTGAVAMAPFTGGTTLALGATAAMGTGTAIGIGVIIAAVAIGIGLLFAIHKEYEEIEFEVGPPPKMKLRKKQK